MTTAPAPLCSAPESRPAAGFSPINNSFAFLVHSQDTLPRNLPPDVDNKPLARQRRRRTSPEDQAVLEDEFLRNQKPDKSARMSIVSRVALSEKEVQIWFQNRRQNSRRRSKPISPHDVSPALSSSQSSMSLRHLHSSDDKEASPASVIDSEPIAPATDAEPEDIAIPDMSAKERSYNTNDEVESQESNMQAPCPQKSTVELRIAKSPDNLSNTTSLKPSQSPRYDRLTAPLLPVPSGTKPPGDDDSTLKSTLPTTNIVGYISNRRSAQTMTAALPMSAKTKSSQPLVPTARNEPQKSLLPRIPVLMKRSSSMIRLALSLEGKAEVVTGDGASIPHDQINYSRRISGRAGCLQRSQSLAEYTSYVAPDTGKTMMPLPRRSLSGRSRDSRTWQFYCDSDARNALSAKAEQEQSGSAVGAIELLRTRCINIMPAKKKRDAEAGKPDVTKRVKATATRTERPKLGRASSSLARLQNQRGDGRKQSSKSKTMFSKPHQQQMGLQSPSGDSDKENWNPGTIETGQSGRSVMEHRPDGRENRSILTENTIIPSRVERLGHDGGHHGTAVTRGKSGSPPRIYVDSDQSDDTGAPRAQPGSGASREEEDLDCVQNLLSLSQGAWR